MVRKKGGAKKGKAPARPPKVQDVQKCSIVVRGRRMQACMSRWSGFAEWRRASAAFPCSRSRWLTRPRSQR